MKLLITTQAMDIHDPILGFFHGWVEEFARHVERIDVICLRKGTYHLPEHVFVHSLGKEEGESRLKYTWRFYRYFWRIYVLGGVDYVFFHMGAIYNIMAAPFFFVRKARRTQFLWWKAHGHINWTGRQALRFVDHVFTSTESGFPIDTDKRRVVGQAIDTARFSLSHTEEGRERQVLFVGRIMPLKRLEVFIETAALLRGKGFVFRAVGPIGDRAYFSGLQKLPGFEEVEFSGPQDQSELPAVYQKAMFFLNTSRTDSMDKTLLEAILCGCIPLTANVAFRDMLAPHGLFFEMQDAAAYAERILSLKEEEVKTIREKLRSEVCDLHSLSTFYNRVFGSL